MPKIGNLEEEIEDSLSYSQDKGKFAMADGETESVFSDLWAKALTRSFISSQQSVFDDVQHLFNQTLIEARKMWYDEIHWKNLEWWKANKATEGSKSTLLILESNESPDTKDLASLKAASVGDTCLLKVRAGILESSFPLTQPEEFGNSPSLVWSGLGYPAERGIELVGPKPSEWEGHMEPGDSVLMATDSVSKWLLTSKEERRWEILLQRLARRDAEEGLKSMFVGLIDGKQMRNDDVSVLAISMGS